MKGLLLVATTEGTALKGNNIWPQQVGMGLGESWSYLDKAGWQTGVHEKRSLHLSGSTGLRWGSARKSFSGWDFHDQNEVHYQWWKQEG